jgi:hypothetical protein
MASYFGGVFAVRLLPVGTYNVTIQAKGFNRVEVRDVVVHAGTDTDLGIRVLAVGGSAEVVNVEGTAPLVDTTGAQITASFESKKILSTPIGSGFDALALYTPGIVSAGGSGYANSNGAQISANGQRSQSNNFQINGQDNNDTSVSGPSIFFGNQDVIAEMQVVTQFNAEYGRNTGAVVNYVTKSGGNQFHGSAFEYQNNSAFWSMTNREKTPIRGWCVPYGNYPIQSGKWPANPAAAGCSIKRISIIALAGCSAVQC